MKVLTCEVCGGHQIKKEADAFVCQECGCQYSLEEVKNLLIDIPDSIEEVAVDASSVNNREIIQRYVNLASSAYESSNFGEAEDYANKALELDDTLWDAWFYKGASAGWQSARDRERFQEMASCFDRAISLCGDLDAMPELKARCYDNLINVCIAYIKLLAGSFSRVPAEEIVDWIKDGLSKVSAVLNGFSLKYKDMPSGWRHPIFLELGLCAVRGHNKTNDEYRDLGFYTEGITLMYRERFTLCLRVCGIALDFYPNGDDKEDLAFFNNAITICDTIKEFSTTTKLKEITYDAKKSWIKFRNQYLERVHKREVIEYWNLHPEEMAELEGELTQLTDVHDSLLQDPSYLELLSRQKSLSKSLKDLERRELLSFPIASRAKRREGKERREEIKRIESELESIRNSLEPLVQREESLSERIGLINARLEDPLRSS